ncbi:MAG TPA: D-glycerate dehydrogenase, partial [Candidatus Dormibacteraeota bacterium]|nr:D-glycerate dehydrogenase [Candidatus Dormibacteraeota bacterium]
MHPFLDPGPAILAEAAEVVAYPAEQPLDEASIRRAAEGCVGIMSQLMDPIRETVLSTPGLKIVSNVAVGFDNIDVAAATAHKVIVTNTPGVLDDATADFAFTLLMAAARRIVEADSFTRQGRFRGWAIDMMLGADVHGATLGLIGVGRIGRGVAHRAKGFNMRVLYYDPQPLPPDAERELGATRADLGRLLAESDFVSVHVPLTPETQHMLSTPQFGQMKRTAILINTSRGPVVDEAALVEALTAKKIAGAGLDVYEREPAVHPGLLTMPNVVLAPHIASATVRTRSEMSAMAARNMATAVRGGRP